MWPGSHPQSPPLAILRKGPVPGFSSLSRPAVSGTPSLTPLTCFSTFVPSSLIPSLSLLTRRS